MTAHFAGEATCRGTRGKSASEPEITPDVEPANLPSKKGRQREVSVLGLLSTLLFFQMLHVLLFCRDTLPKALVKDNPSPSHEWSS